MTGFDIVPFDRSGSALDEVVDPRLKNWPVVYVMDGKHQVYVGETLSLVSRMRQHGGDRRKDALTSVRVVMHDEFNKSACLDLESYLIRMFAGDGRYEVVNVVAGIRDAAYYDRERYQAHFDQIFDELRERGLFERTVPEIINSDLFKFSPFKALSLDQAVAVENVLEALFDDIQIGSSEPIVVQGDPGTGKTVVAVYLIKLLRDIATASLQDDPDVETVFAEFFVPENAALLADFRIGLAVPQQSLRATLQKVFARTPGLKHVSVLTPFEVGKSSEHFDLLVVDEAHRLNHRANQPAGPLNAAFATINAALFGHDDDERTQLDWVRARSTHQILLVDPAQSVRPADLPAPVVKALVESAKSAYRYFPLRSQLRVRAGDDYTSYVRSVLRGEGTTARAFPGYDLRFFDDLGTMRREIEHRDAETGLARLVAGYAWKWVSKKDRDAYDIELDGIRMRWNGTQTDWVSSPASLSEVGSIHTIQGYDLNYAGVIIGPDLRFDSTDRRLWFDRSNYFDTKGMENNKRRGIEYTDTDILEYVTNIYGVLLTRGISGTYVYVCDPELRRYLRPYFSNAI
ncbi:DNA/RNA helicase domain-containing protein [uncultured Leifsonia sp.]|uniref:DNA/RNA helicase domain-containing protein n=1 Tax=uncultured Leifsonia sp. TaxID=340359 RepID=UPI0025E8431F|nr:DNA/RNA helicase domain-containing protein [uncultured Leifsonia sp.]